MTPSTADNAPARTPPGHPLEVARVFLRLGLMSFGGPIAHIGYFHREFVERRRWVDEQHFGQLFALCQFLPGPASSQLGFSIGLLCAGWLGALAAFVCFTLPSALLMFAFAEASSQMAGPWGQAIIHGLKLVAVVVVAQGVLGMARTLCPDRPRAFIAAATVGLIALSSSAWMQLLVVAGGAALGPWACRQVEAKVGETFALHYGPRTGAGFLVAYGALLAIALLATPLMPPMGQIASAFYRAGALVFGGGHVVLPLLKQAVVDPGWITPDRFLAGYGAAQTVPGPMFTLSAYLGGALHGGQGGALGAIVSLLAIFLPGLLMVSGALPFWRTMAARTQAIRMLAGVNAAVVGLLAFALYNPVWVSAIQGGKDFAIALIAFVGLIVGKWPPLLAVAWCVVTSLICVLSST
ncbi:chromate efflux transporter [Rhodanobacter sp. DHG33]|uniref:chromate efflux transporter n=1 Tax=Rhodanobacter sp. DHG33 TaxID=2775921 RepID=UPI00177D6044|nr:chromate efflux transporter [Rhodanobacter sp. DHG33]MBD8897895.1 chromate efflux transporter [Rhodanobacter sp. DHG33]